MKTNKNKKLIALGLMIAMFVLYGVLPLPQGAKANVYSLTNAAAKISDSDISANATTTLTFVTTQGIPAGGTIKVTLNSAFDDIKSDGNVNCGAGTVTRSGKTATCTYAAGVATGSPMTILVGTKNPSADGFYSILIETFNGATLLDHVTTMVYIIHDVTMTAKVDPILIFTINGVGGNTKSVNGVNCSATTTATSTPFGTLVVNATTTVCQRLNVTTNADDGYIVTVEENHELLSDSGSNINSFNNAADGTGSTTPTTWFGPKNILDSYHTYGHMGFTSDDQDLGTFGYNNYYNGGAGAQYVGFNSTDPVVVMHHNGPSDGTAQNIGLAYVAYSAQIASLQEAGDYENTLTYIATPTY